MPARRKPKLPLRLQLSRAAGADLQKLSAKANGRACVRVDRATEWGNHHLVVRERPFSFSVDGCGDFATKQAAHAHAVALHAADCVGKEDRIRAALADRNLACWCAPDEPCHADTLLRIANEGSDKRGELAGSLMADGTPVIERLTEF